MSTIEYHRKDIFLQSYSHLNIPNKFLYITMNNPLKNFTPKLNKIATYNLKTLETINNNSKLLIPTLTYY